MDTEDRLALQALEEARVTRHCPPAELLLHPDERVLRHIQDCDHCRERHRQLQNGPEDDSEVIGDLIAKAQSIPELSELLREAEQEPVAPGQVRLLREDIFESTFDGNHWNNAPFVLILKETSIKGVVRVAQIGDCAELAGPGDVFLSEDEWERSFAESWNTWPVLEGDLGPVLSAVDQSVLKKVLELSSELAPSAGTPLRREFRDMELGIGYRYGSYGAAQALELHKFYASSWSGILPSPKRRGEKPLASSAAFRKVRGVISHIKSVSSTVPAPNFALAADTHPVQLTSQHRAILEYSFGRSHHGYVNVFEFSSFSEERPGHKKIDAEFFTAGGTLHAVFDWGDPEEKGRLRAAVLLGGEEVWLETGLEFGRRTITLETEEADISSLLPKMKILVFGV